MKNIFTLLFSITVICFLNACSTTGSTARCPDMSARHIQRPVMAHKNYSLPKNTKALAKNNDNSTTARKGTESPILAFLKQETPINTRIPSYLEKEINAGNFEKVNNVLAQYSDNKVALTHNSKGEMIVSAKSFKSFNKMAQQIVFKKPAQRMSEDARDILALIGGILGIVSAGTSPIPYFNFFSIFVGAGAIVLGILGINSFSRRKWALIGIILGAIGVTLSILFIILYFVVLGLWWF